MSISKFREELDYFKICFLQSGNKIKAKFSIPSTLLTKLRPYCEKIADERMNEYINKRGHNKNREGLIKDFMRGFIAEFFVYSWWYNILEQKNQEHLVTFPDFNLRKDENREHDADIKVSTTNIHIKSIFTDSSLPWSYSCNFQKNNFQDKFSNKDWLFAIGIDSNLNDIQIEYFCSLNFLKDNDYLDSPIKKSMAYSKYAVYFRNLPNRNKTFIDTEKFPLKFQFKELIKSLKN